VAVKLTELPCGKVMLHVTPQLIPPGLLITVPLPVPANDTVSCPDGTTPTQEAKTVPHTTAIENERSERRQRW